MRFIHSVARIEGGCQIFVCVLMQAKWNDRCTVQFFQFILFLFFLENMRPRCKPKKMTPKYRNFRLRSSLKHRNFKIAFEKIDFQNRFIRAKNGYATLCLFLVSCLFSLEKIVCYLLPSTNLFCEVKNGTNTSQRYLFYLLKFQHSMRPNPINFRL